MKNIILFLIFITSSGCTCLSYQNYSKVEGHHTGLVDKVYSNERVAQIELNNVSLQFRSWPHENKSLLVGPIIPLFPIWGYDNPGERWVELKNSGTSGIIRIKNLIGPKNTVLDCEISESEHRKGSTIKTFSTAPLHVLKLTPKETIWINLPNKGTVKILIDMNNKSYEIKIKEAIRLQLHFVSA